MPAELGQDHQQQAGQHEAGGQDRGRAGQDIGGTAAGHEVRHAAAPDAKRPTFALLHQHDADQGRCHHEMNDQDNPFHIRFYPPTACAGRLLLPLTHIG